MKLFETPGDMQIDKATRKVAAATIDAACSACVLQDVLLDMC